MGVKNIIGELQVNGSKVVTEDTLENAGGGGGLSIKKIEFTDRPTLYAWLQNNLDKVVKAVMTTNQFPAPVNYSTVLAQSGGSITYYFLQYHISTRGSMDAGDLTLQPYASVAAVTSLPFVSYAEGEVGVSGVSGQLIPDEYWGAMELCMTIYYIE